MRAVILGITLFISFSAVASGDLISVDAYKLCPNLRNYTYKQTVQQSTIQDCIEVIEENKFSLAPLNICLNLPYYSSYDYYVDGVDIVRCFKKIANKEYTAGRIEYCQNLKEMNFQNGYKTMPVDVSDCLK